MRTIQLLLYLQNFGILGVFQITNKHQPKARAYQMGLFMVECEARTSVCKNFLTRRQTDDSGWLLSVRSDINLVIGLMIAVSALEYILYIIILAIIIT